MMNMREKETEIGGWKEKGIEADVKESGYETPQALVNEDRHLLKESGGLVHLREQVTGTH